MKLDLMEMVRKSGGENIKLLGWKSYIKVFINPENSKLTIFSDEILKQLTKKRKNQLQNFGFDDKLAWKMAIYPDTVHIGFGGNLFVNGEALGNIEIISEFSDTDLQILKVFGNKLPIEFSSVYGGSFALFNSGYEWFFRINYLSKNSVYNESLFKGNFIRKAPVIPPFQGMAYAFSDSEFCVSEVKDVMV